MGLSPAPGRSLMHRCAPSGTRANDKGRPYPRWRQRRSALGSDRGEHRVESGSESTMAPNLLWTAGFGPDARDPQDLTRRMLWPPCKEGGNYAEADAQAFEQRRESVALCETVCRWLRGLASKQGIRSEHY